MKNFIPGLVSIIMPSYNTGRFLLETIQSVQNQTYQNWEIILVDDCSTDDTLEILSKINDSRINILINKTNSGAAVSRNKALQASKGEWIAFLDSDDLWTPDKLEKQIKFMKDNNYEFSCTYSSYIDENSIPIGKIDTAPKRINKYAMFAYNWIGCLTVMYHYPTVGLIQIADIKKRNDYAMWLKVIKKVDCYCLPEVLAHYRVRKKSVSHDSYFKLIKAHYQLFRECEKQSFIVSVFFTFMNITMAVLKKTFFIKLTSY